jgi:hypothetical protein
MLASNKVASVNISQSRLQFRFGTRLRSHQVDSSAVSLHRQPATARAPPASRSATATSLRTSQQPALTAQPAVLAAPLSVHHLRAAERARTSSLQRRLDITSPLWGHDFTGITSTRQPAFLVTSAEVSVLNEYSTSRKSTRNIRRTIT